MNQSDLELYIKNGFSTYQISKKEGISQTTVSYWIKKFGLKTLRAKNPNLPLKQWDWSKIQESYDKENLSWRELSKKFNISICVLWKASKDGRFKSRTSGQSNTIAHKLGKFDYSVFRTPEYRKSKSKIGGYKRNSGRSKGKWVKNLEEKEYWLQSSYEVKMAKILNDKFILWERPESVKYTLNGKESRYYADFILPKYNIFLDTKNDYLIKIDSEKIKAVKEQNNINLLVVSKKDINENFINSIINHE